MNYITVFVILGLATASNGASILVLSPMPTRSHYNLFDKLSIQLAKRGHDITLISPFKQPKPIPNLTELVIDNIYETLVGSFRGNNSNILSMKTSPWKGLLFLPKMGLLLSEKVLEMEALQNLIKIDRKFDLLIAESFLFDSMIGGLSYKFKAPVVIVSPFMTNYWANYLVGNPAPASYVPDPFLGYSSHMNFWERLANTVYTFVQELNFHFNYLPQQDALMKKYFGHHLPPLKEIMKNTSMVLVNHHVSLAYSKPYLPNMIEIGGYHVTDPQPLPQDLKKFMDESKQGVILLSLGSHLKSTDMPREMIDNIIGAFARLKQNVLWKFEGDTLKNLPRNIKIMKWLPQKDLLAHPNLKLFVTHGGLLSTTEAVSFGVPLVGIPILGDQMVNMEHASKSGFAVTVLPEEMTEDLLYNAIQEVLNTPKYLENVKRISKILKDQPMKPMDSAIYWIEYVIRHKGASHMRSSAQDLTWYELYMVDVFGLLFVAAFGLVYLPFFLGKMILKKLLSKKSPNKSKKNVHSSKKKN